jgi:hypothetical protein
MGRFPERTGWSAAGRTRQRRPANAASAHGCGACASFAGAISTRDGEIGHVDDAFIEDETWHIRYLLVDTSNWIGGTHVPVPTSAIRAVDWTAGRIDVDLTRDRIRLAPPYDPARPLDRIVEQALERHYNVETLGRRPLSRTAGA